MAVCPEVIYSQGGVVLVIRIGDLPMGSGTPGLQYCGKQFYSLLDHICANRYSGDPTDQALQKPLKYKILAWTKGKSPPLIDGLQAQAKQ